MTISLLRTLLASAALAALVACSGGPPPSAAPAPVPEPEPEEVAEAERVRPPEIPVAERIRAPFAVQSEGRTAPREPRQNLVVVDRPAQSPAARPAPAAERPAAAAPTPAPRTPPAGAAAPPQRGAAAGTAAASGAAPRPAGPRQHTVEVGETFFGIARRYGVTPAALSAVNAGVDGERLRAGQVLQLPAYATRPAANGGAPATAAQTPRPPATPAQAPAQARPQPAPAAQPRAGQRTHRVESGETLWGIARRYGVTPEQIRTANRMTDETVRLGQTLVIPNG